MATKNAVLASITPEEKAEIILKSKAVAVAMAELWDALGEVEGNHNTSIDVRPEYYSSLAAECNCPPSFADLSDESVWEQFESEVEQ